MRKLISIPHLLFFLPLLCMLITGEAQSLPYVFQSATDGYTCFRIPAILQSGKGTLLAFAEARKYSCKDEGRIDLVLKRSTDGGRTWGPLTVVWSDSANTCGNPVPVLDKRTGTILLLLTWNLAEDAIGAINAGTGKDTRRVFITRSADDGLSWQKPQEITAQVKRSTWGWYATGPCHGIQLNTGRYKGRIVIPCDNMTTGAGVPHTSHSHVIFSDDGGIHWILGGVADLAGGNESSVTELSDGSLLLSMRTKPWRAAARSTDGGESWTTDPIDSLLPDPACQGAVCSPADGHTRTVYFSNPSAARRINMTIHASDDDGRHWPRTYQVYNGPSAYSDMALLDRHHLAILYEAGIARSNEGIAFRIIDTDDIK